MTCRRRDDSDSHLMETYMAIDDDESLALEQELPEAETEINLDDISNDPEQLAQADDEDEKEEWSRKVKKRIDKLVYERNVEREERIKLKAEIDELKSYRQQELQQKSNAELEQKRKALFDQKRESLEIGDYEAVAQIDDELMDIKVQLRTNPKPNVETRQPAYAEPKTPNVPQAQAEWEAVNPWVFDAKQKGRVDKANAVFTELLNDGYDADDPDTYRILDKRLKREAPPATGGIDRGGVVGASKDTAFTSSDKQMMVGWGLDPNNPAHRKEWAKNR